MASGFKPGLGSAVWSPDLTPTSEPQYIGALIGLFILSIGFRALVAAQGYLEAYLHLHFYPRPLSSSHSSHSHNPYLQHQQQQVDENDSHDEDAEHQDLTLDNSNINNSNSNGDHAVLPLPEKNDKPSTPLSQQGQGMTQQLQQSGPTHTTPSRPKRYGGRRHHSPPPFYAAASPTQSSSLPFLTFPTAQPFIWQAEVARAVLTTAVVGIGYMLMLVIMTYNSAYLGVILAGVFVGEVYFARWGRARPIFPSSSATISRTRTSRVNEMKQQQQQSSNGTATAVTRTAAISRTSLASTNSSNGYSTAMAHHGLSGDGSC
ncbi:hypothetical protein K457DRAFT_142002 [Linnemannia elongata AG-77]|uniref:Copper transport protein n=1 Tax=Linnemannia elongata AG-77 TaxID=1314771 RepID=A0A197JHD6_9FUNG|nr:hypothetical protein K457DRAFT_142002 [Linnemannia elongata AG-77]